MPPNLQQDNHHDSDGHCIDLRMLHQRVTRLEDALPRDDLGKPDFDGHRTYHTDKIESSKTLRNYQQEVTKNLLRAGATILIMTFGAGYSDYVVAIFKAFVP